MSPSIFSRLVSPLLTLITLLSLGSYASAQEPSLDIATTNKADVIVYRMLFRQVAAYKRISDQARAAHEDKSYLRGIIARRIGISGADYESLERLSSACEDELTPIQTSVAGIVHDFHMRYASIGAGSHKDASPPPELADLQSQEDAIILRYRDLWRNTMNEPDFQRVQSQIRQTFERGFSRGPVQTNGVR